MNQLAPCACVPLGAFRGLYKSGGSAVKVLRDTDGVWTGDTEGPAQRYAKGVAVEVCELFDVDSPRQLQHIQLLMLPGTLEISAEAPDTGPFARNACIQLATFAYALTPNVQMDVLRHFRTTLPIFNSPEVRLISAPCTTQIEPDCSLRCFQCASISFASSA